MCSMELLMFQLCLLQLRREGLNLSAVGFTQVLEFCFSLSPLSLTLLIHGPWLLELR